jgi:hypothetical protein
MIGSADARVHHLPQIGRCSRGGARAQPPPATCPDDGLQRTRPKVDLCKHQPRESKAYTGPTSTFDMSSDQGRPSGASYRIHPFLWPGRRRERRGDPAVGPCIGGRLDRGPRRASRSITASSTALKQSRTAFRQRSASNAAPGTTATPRSSPPTKIRCPSRSSGRTGRRAEYDWKTDKSWGGTCRELQPKLADNTVDIARFTFT